tara:strand:+ start:101 stop:253 length:153 start_codon:yes stop_codon:yes gene_type:complete
MRAEKSLLQEDVTQGNVLIDLPPEAREGVVAGGTPPAPGKYCCCGDGCPP